MRAMLRASGPSATACRWDLICRVVDNYGDAGVSWRLARQLVHDHGIAVCLWIDRPETLQALLPPLDPQQAEQVVEGVTVRVLTEAATPDDDVTAVLESFGCGLPARYLQAMVSRDRPPCWVVLEYLSAESWVASHHGLASPHPQLSLQRWFYFPGFEASTGGLLRERDLFARRESFDDAAVFAFRSSLGLQAPVEGGFAVLLFAYAQAPVAEWFKAMARASRPVTVYVPKSVLWPAVGRFFGQGELRAGQVLARNALTVQALPFLPQRQFDELLWSCDFNIVRGEDSFVRAQWAGRPMIWRPYPQAGGTDLDKMNAFLTRYLAGWPAAGSAAVADFYRAWSGNGDADWPERWRLLTEILPEWRKRAPDWARELENAGDMAAKLVEFVQNRLQ
jgi:uncharacterized repeat protein (TIGR03837 family)